MHIVDPKDARGTKLALPQHPKPIITHLEEKVHFYVPSRGPVQGCSECERIATSTPHVKHLDAPSQGQSKSKYRYAIYPPLVLFSSEVPLEDAHAILSRSNCTHAAINKPIPNEDIIRRPQIQPLIGEFGPFPSSDFNSAFWCTTKQNGIFQTWAPMYTMFSRGNITEKKRVLEFKGIQGTTVIDLYCGIGYFTFSYAQSNAAVVYGWEINPWSIEGLRRAAKVNKWNVRIIRHNEIYEKQSSDKLVIFAEDNAEAVNRIPQLDLTHVSHINMGLLPDCHKAWPVAKKLAKKGTILHVHENVHNNDLAKWSESTAREMGELVHLEKIKQFSPGVWHVCGDFRYP